jgi:hypothetical protein
MPPSCLYPVWRSITSGARLIAVITGDARRMREPNCCGDTGEFLRSHSATCVAAWLSPYITPSFQDRLALLKFVSSQTPASGRPLPRITV